MRPQSLAERLLEGLRIISDTAFRLFTDPELVATAFKNLAGQKMRRNLTLLGIVIGIFSITALLALGQALDASIEGEFERLGLNTIHIQAGEDIGSSVYARLGENDAEHIAGIPFVEQVIPFYETAGVVKSRNSEASVFIIGVETEDYPYLEQIGYLSLASGRYPDDADTDALVVYENFTTDAFDHDVPLRGTVELKDRKFRIVGISAQSDVAFGGLGITNMVFTNKKTVSDLFGEDRPTEILVSVTDRERVDETAKRITATLEREHDEKDFTVNTAENLLAQSLAILGVVQFFVLAISAISILVGGIGITNTMFMAVSERTREIGTMKAMGATDALIRSLFLAEAAIIGLSGGILGIIVGYIAAFGIAAFASQAGFALPLTLDAGTIVFGVGFSVLIGVIAGLAPAEKAIRLDPVEAIRYE